MQETGSGVQGLIASAQSDRRAASKVCLECVGVHLNRRQRRERRIRIEKNDWGRFLRSLRYLLNNKAFRILISRDDPQKTAQSQIAAQRSEDIKVVKNYRPRFVESARDASSPLFSEIKQTLERDRVSDRLSTERGSVCWMMNAGKLARIGPFGEGSKP